jgi:hypothetical protein
MTLPEQGRGRSVTQFEVPLAANQKSGAPQSFDGPSLAFNPASLF